MMTSLTALILVACIDNQITPKREEPPDPLDTGGWQVDTAAFPDTGSGPPSDDSGPPPDSADPDTAIPDTGDTPDTDNPCHDFTFTWYPPLGGHMVMSGEFQTPDGTVSVPWRDWAEADGGFISYTWAGMCSTFNFRGSVSLDLDGSGASSWTCVNQSDGSDAIVGTVEFYLDSTPLDVIIYPDPETDGCGVITEARW